MWSTLYFLNRVSMPLAIRSAVARLREITFGQSKPDRAR
jgi:hypothetical protein